MKIHKVLIGVGGSTHHMSRFGQELSVVSVWYRAAKVAAERLSEATRSLFRMNLDHRIGKLHEDPS